MLVRTVHRAGLQLVEKLAKPLTDKVVMVPRN